MPEFDLVIRGGTIVDGSGAAPFAADIGIKGDRIIAVVPGLGAGASEIDAAGRIVTPGFVDVHTHYDGQAVWGERLSPSSSHGVTTVVMGNCGVGFAPCRAEDREVLINVMEGVEDIPGVVMAEGLPWNWESFPDYLDVLDSGRRDIDVAAYLPHSPLRVFAMGARGADREAATPQDLALMRDLTRQAIDAGALGFATSRLSIHKTADGGSIPSFDAELAELTAICDGMADAGAGTLQIVLDAFRGWDKEFGVIESLVASSGRPATFTLASGNDGPPRWRTVLDRMDAANAVNAAQITAQVLPRPIGLIAGLELSVHPFSLSPSYQKIAGLPLADRVAAMRDPEMRAALLSETPDPGHPFNSLARNWKWMFPLNDPPDYAPPASASIEAQALARGCSAQEVVYDRFLETDGKGLLLAALGNYEDGSLDSAHTMLTHKDCIPALGDGGAHYGAICDASYSTYLLAHWARDAAESRIPLPDAVAMLTHKSASAVGLSDRGLLRPGYKADLNVIDLDRLALHIPHLAHDLPGGGRRLDQAASGYDATIVSGQVIRRFDAPTEALPGRLVRGAQPVPV
jgi:N-acyl-D-aspartate/D-glutamate deacylase